MQYSEKHQVEYDECDENKNLRLASLIDLMMQVSEHQLWHGDASTKSLNERGLGWVVTQYHFEINRLPRVTEKVVLTTEAKGYNRFFEYRDFSIDDQAGNKLITVKSEWVLFDLKKRKMVATDEKMMNELHIPLLPKLPHFPRLRQQAEYEKKRQYRVRYDDLDTNHHLTNSHYFNWFLDMLDREFLRQHVVSKIEIKFNQEVRYGQEPYSCVTVKENDAETKSYHAIEDDEGKARALCELTWREI
ncbi:thioesterase [Lactobacillus sp. ESL0791]|uniref:acyl-[acyl-carrier-protein] thioesterase n=1 Tax=Lactobacillus sp. ESL0791 TaxID=2983234 RepID=UPI0023F96283|nr:acyl-ACP thioesterase domain-containing protein [Lactobacillus sp. ESL0791]MDF7638397.1 thioesterase [Lactobacillus sp. ESL0791]